MTISSERLRLVPALLALCVAGVAGAAPDGAYRLAGTWVNGQTLRDLDAGTVTDAAGCHLVISAEPLGVTEICRGWSGAWEGPFRLQEKGGRVELEGTGPTRPDASGNGGGSAPAPRSRFGFGAGGRRLVVVRAGVPNELQLGSAQGLRSVDGVQGFYRLDEDRASRLQGWMEKDPPAAEPIVAPAERPVPPAAPEEVPIAQPIAPKPRVCGCSAGEGALGSGMLALALAALARRRR